MNRLVQGPFGGMYASDFFTALNTQQSLQLQREEVNKRADSTLWNKIEKTYISFIERLSSPLLTPPPQNIPLHIFFIWINLTNPLAPAPLELIDVIASYQKFHEKSKGWKLTLVDEQEGAKIISQMGKEFPNIVETYVQAETAAEKADILRCCLLYKCGGLYVDTDMYCLGSFLELHHFTDFYCAIESLLFPDISCCTAAMGSIPHHPLIKSLLQGMRPKRPDENKFSILYRTGPQLLSRCIREYIADENTHLPHSVLVLPPSYFYPMPYSSTHFNDKKEPLQLAQSWKVPWSKGIHLWMSRW